MANDTPWWLKRLKQRGQAHGFLTQEQINQAMPTSVVDPEEIGAIVDEITRLGIRVVENEQSERRSNDVEGD